MESAITTQWRKVEFRKPFELTIQLQENGADVRADSIDWVLTFTTGGAQKYVACRENGVLVNCTIDKAGKVVVIFQNHHLEPGRMWCELESDNDASRFATGIELSSGIENEGNEFAITANLPSKISVEVDVIGGEWKRVEYRRVFALSMQLVVEGNKMRADECDWKITFTTGGVGRYTAYSIKGVTSPNAQIESDGKLKIYFRNQRLEAGRMWGELVTDFSNNKDTHRFPTGVELTNGIGDDAREFDIDVQLPYVNVGLSESELWEQLAIVDESKVIDKSHIPSDTYVLPYDMSAERTYSYLQSEYNKIEEAITENRVVIISLGNEYRTAECEADNTTMIIKTSTIKGNEVTMHYFTTDSVSKTTRVQIESKTLGSADDIAWLDERLANVEAGLTDITTISDSKIKSAVAEVFR